MTRTRIHVALRPADLQFHKAPVGELGAAAGNRHQQRTAVMAVDGEEQ
jgi:hypothetical protein